MSAGAAEHRRRPMRSCSMRIAHRNRNRRMLRSPALALVMLTFGAAAAQAPSAAQPAPPGQTQPNQAQPNQAPSNQAACPPGTGPNAPTVGSGQSGNLSDKLANSNGVICPPAGVDPQMHVAPPQEGGRMPVIPPPGTPGGDQKTVPK